MLIILVYLLINHTIAFRLLNSHSERHIFKSGNIIRMIGSITQDASFLTIRDEDIYLTKVISKSISSVQSCLKDGKQLIEIEFPANRKSDISVTQTLARNRIFVRKFVKPFESLGKQLWIVFPDGKELFLAQQDASWGENLPFTLTTINKLISFNADNMPSTSSAFPKLIVAVNPGFNVDEWINLAKVQIKAPTVIVNGNIDRLRNGYYPSLFYPELTRVSKQYYSQATQAFYLSPIAVKGNRFGAWLTKIYGETDWEVIVQSPSKSSDNSQSSVYTSVLKSDSCPNGAKAWQIAKDEYSKNFADGDAIQLLRKLKLSKYQSQSQHVKDTIVNEPSVASRSTNSNKERNDVRDVVGLGDQNADVNSTILTTRLIRFTDELFVTLYEDSLGATASGNGATLWDASILLCHYLIEKYGAYDSNHRNYNVVDLGAGLGCVSMLCAILKFARVYSTERELAIRLLRHNIESNVANSESHENVMNNIKILKLDWCLDRGHCCAIAPGDDYTRIHLVVGSDLVFPGNKEVWESLAITYAEYIKRYNCIGLLAYERRHPDSICSFITLLENERLNVLQLDKNMFSRTVDNTYLQDVLSSCEDIFLLQISNSI